MRFIHSTTDSKSVVEKWIKAFRSIKAFEEEWNCDIAEYDHSGVYAAMESAFGSSTSSKRRGLSFMKKYVGWYKSETGRNTSSIIENSTIDDMGLGKIRYWYVSSPLHLQSRLDKSFDPESDENTDNVCRCIFWLVYSGIPEDVAVNIKTSDVDLSQMTVFDGAKDVPIYREGMASLKNCVCLDRFRRVGRYGLVTQKRKDREKLLCGIHSTMNVITMRTVISQKRKIKSELNPEILNEGLAMRHVWVSGMFYRLYELERAGYPVSITPIVEAIASRSRSGNQNPKTVNSRIRRIRSEILIDYNNWKKVFSV